MLNSNSVTKRNCQQICAPSNCLPRPIPLAGLSFPRCEQPILKQNAIVPEFVLRSFGRIAFGSLGYVLQITNRMTKMRGFATKICPPLACFVLQIFRFVLQQLQVCPPLSSVCPPRALNCSRFFVQWSNVGLQFFSRRRFVLHCPPNLRFCPPKTPGLSSVVLRLSSACPKL